MSTENEGNAVPSAPDAPSAPAPEETPQRPTAPATAAPGAAEPAPSTTPAPPAAAPAAPAPPTAPPAAPAASAVPGASAAPAGEQPTAAYPTTAPGGPATPPPPAAPPAYPPHRAPAPAYAAAHGHEQPPAHDGGSPPADAHAAAGQGGGGHQGGGHQEGGQAGGPAGGGHSAAAGYPAAGYPANGGQTPAGGGHGGGWGGWGTPPGLPPVPPSPRKRSGGLIAAVLVAALVAGGVGGGFGYWAAERNDTSASTTISAGDTPADFKRDPGTVAAIAAKALPSVVTIEAKSGAAEGEGGTGTGFVYDKEGHIVTNNHVVASAADGGAVTATFADGKKYDAEVVGRAQGYDVAVLKLRNAPSGLTPLPLGDSEKVAVGDATIAIGAPFGLSNTVTTGIISAKNRPVASSDGSGGKNSYMSALQTDASINPGNSGGPLLDARGAVIGINSAIQSPGSGGLGQSQAGSVGLGFAIPVNQAKNVAEQLIKTGEPVYPMIGATVNMTEKGEGATIVDQGTGGTAAITPNGPAAKAGLRPGDVITRFGNRIIDSGPTLISEIWTHKPGDTVTVTYKRGGQEKQVQITLGERKGD
ncbi:MULTISPECIES: S1C family serine protease [Streptomyces]|uniref:Protease n=2 Tax=Streptomyces TaxID=1883 RepID=A0A100Y6Q1_9ACTN|nr:MULTISPECIES: trypsin-like peptidase domain-containing protein [Streptomyces]KUH38683.1 protease [Streptomyces kanasensis]UUS32054.1 trypsin-like peptidase domain-containing protein [Streptomyces changanensis]